MSTTALEEFVESLNEHGVRYLVVGAYAVAHHARPRATNDLDIWVEPTPENAECTVRALDAFFRGTTGVDVADFSEGNRIVRFGHPPNQVDIASKVDGIAGFAQAWKRRSPGRFRTVATSFVSLRDLIATKRAVADMPGRADKFDAADLRVLLAVARGGPGKGRSRGRRPS